VRRNLPDSVSIFIEPPSLAVLESRLRERGTESEESIQRRLAGARRELERAASYDHRVVNGQLDLAVEEVHALIARLISRN
jgi:guanylate kinase